MNQLSTKPNSFIALMLDLASGRDSLQNCDGLPGAILEDAAASLGVSPQRLFAVVRLSGTAADAMVDRRGTLDVSVSECIRRLANVALLAFDVFGDEEAAKRWLRTANRAFRASAPMDYIATEKSSATVYQVLNALSTGGPA